MSTAFKYNRLSKDDAVVLLVDHQAGLISLVQDFSPGEFKNNVLALADVGEVLQAADHPDHQLRERPERPTRARAEGDCSPTRRTSRGPARSTPGTTRISSAAIKKTGRKQLIMAGVVTDVCVAFPALSALEEGYEVFVVTDASGTFNETCRARGLVADGAARARK